MFINTAVAFGIICFWMATIIHDHPWNWADSKIFLLLGIAAFAIALMGKLLQTVFG